MSIFERDPLQPVSTNTLSSPASTSAAAAAAVASASSSSTPRNVKLAPIFTRTYSRPRPSPSSAQNGPPSSPCPARDDDERIRKRAKLDVHAGNGMEIDENMDGDGDLPRGRLNSIQDYFVTTPLRAEVYSPEINAKSALKSAVQDVDIREQCVWRRRRGRGVRQRACMTVCPEATTPITPYLSTLVTRLSHDALQPPSLLLIPSLHPWHHPRDYAPPLAVAFSHAAKLYSAGSAKANSKRRLIAVAAEEGGVRVLDVDEPAGMHRDAQGWFWRAHGNAVLDVKWSGDDSKILTASGDATARLHALNGPTPTLIATLTGHTASLKSCTFFDPLGGSVDPATSSTVIATAGRDGNILIYDVRAPGNTALPSSDRRSGRNTRYSEGVPGFAPQVGGEIAPVMEIKSAHDPSKKKGAKSISSIVALRSMPGCLASGAAHEGIVKVWDPRFNPRSATQAIASLPDPTIHGMSKRPRGIHSMVEQPSTGDVHILTADSRIHAVRPSATTSQAEAIQPVQYTHSELRSSFWMGLAFSPCGRYLASGSARGGLMTWDTEANSAKGYNRERTTTEVNATKLGMGHTWDGTGKEREVNAVDWGYDMLAACADDFGTRIWREDADVGRRLQVDPKLGEEWAGVVC